jgi:hypothetical protein
MSGEREAELMDTIEGQKNLALASAFRELFSIRIERCRDKLEAGENPLSRGEARGYRKMLELLS